MILISLGERAGHVRWYLNNDSVPVLILSWNDELTTKCGDPIGRTYLSISCQHGTCGRGEPNLEKTPHSLKPGEPATLVYSSFRTCCRTFFFSEVWCIAVLVGILIAMARIRDSSSSTDMQVTIAKNLPHVCWSCSLRNCYFWCIFVYLYILPPRSALKCVPSQKWWTNSFAPRWFVDASGGKPCKDSMTKRHQTTWNIDKSLERWCLVKVEKSSPFAAESTQ